jgi:hypothetical protein
MALSKGRISSPLEAGPSILDVQHLPPHLNEALEYASKRLARKSLHITLVVVRREYQLPTVVPPCATPDLSPAASPERYGSRLGFAASPVAAFKQLVKGSAQSAQARSAGLPSPPPDADPASPRARWPMSPVLPMSPPPMTPSTAASSSVTDASGPMTPNPFGIRLIHANLLSAQYDKIVRQTIDKTERKFQIGYGPFPHTPHESG